MTNGMSGKEIHDLLEGACADAGLSEYQTRQLMLSFSIRWGDLLRQQIDMAMYANEMNMPEEVPDDQRE